jgi:hypothetical protein
MNIYISIMGLLLVLGSLSCKSELSAQKKKESPLPEHVEFCELTRKPDQYRNKMIQTEAIFSANSENTALYSPECRSAGEYMWAVFDPSYTNTDDSVKKKFDKLGCPRPPCASVTIKMSVVGRFEGPSQEGYGHLNRYRFRFVITRIISVDQVP